MWINGITEIRRHGSKLRRIYGITNLRIHGYSIMTEYKKTYKKGTYGKKESRNYESTDSRKHIVWINGITETRSEDLRIYEMAEGQVSDISIN